MRLSRLVAKIPPDFGHVSPNVHYWLFGPLLVAQLGYIGYAHQTSMLCQLGLSSAGIFFWTLMEYMLHRFSFHSKSEHYLMKPFNSGLHLIHHDQPSNKKYVTAPVILALPVYLITMGVFYLFLGNAINTLSFGSGILEGFLVYEYVHYISHLTNPRFFIFKYLKKQHMLHHFKDEQSKFGVTSPLWDWFFNTYNYSDKE
jgi:sterol desaturase/sphingolipid hydroxylase (fatty acid hydroxylase superfamily)